MVAFMTFTSFLHPITSLKNLLLFTSILSYSFSNFVKAAQSNITVDDQGGDPTNDAHILYTPSGAWNVGQSCAGCTAKPSPQSDAYLGTWMDATFNPNGTTTNKTPGQIPQASFNFIGKVSIFSSYICLFIHSIFVPLTYVFGSCRNCGVCDLYIDRLVDLSRWEH